MSAFEMCRTIEIQRQTLSQLKGGANAALRLAGLVQRMRLRINETFVARSRSGDMLLPPQTWWECVPSYAWISTDQKIHQRRYFIDR
jgi:hypothetical protein